MIKFNAKQAKSLRNSFGYTQQYVANYLNCTKSGYCYIEQGKRQPSVEKLGNYRNYITYLQTS